MSTPRAASTLPPLAIPFASLFVLSGACGLTYEVVWTRLLVQLFGVTAFAVSAVLASFMGGMALGAALLARRADRSARPLRLFALLEAGIGAYALLLPKLLPITGAIQAAILEPLPDTFAVRSAVRLVLCAALLLVPTMLMGATLPTLSRGLLERSHDVGLGVGLLYFVNTLGAAIGCALTGFFLLPRLGLSGTTLLAAAGNGIVAVTAWVVDRRFALARAGAPEAASGAEAGPEPEPAPASGSWPLCVAFGSGLAALAFEVVWFRVLVQVFGSTVYSFSAMLSVFLLGLALGSLLFGPIADRVRRPMRLLFWLQAGAAACAACGLLAVPVMPELFLRALRLLGFSSAGMTQTKLLLSFIALLPPALAFGGTFPVVVRLVTTREPVRASRIGAVYAWNTLGAIVGALGAGFLLLPTVGSEWTLRLVVVVGVALALGSLIAERGGGSLLRRVPAGVFLVVLVGVALVSPRWDRRLLGMGPYFEVSRFYAPDGTILLGEIASDHLLKTYHEGYNETISSFENLKGKSIHVNGSVTASNQFEDMFPQRMLGHLPMAVHPTEPRRVCVVGLGAGVTAGAIGLYEPERLTVVELEKGVLEASRFFEKENHDILGHPRLDLRIDDGRNFLARTRDRFDVISSAPDFPALTGSGALFSEQYFRLCRARLAPGGVMCQFAPIWGLVTEDLRTIVGTFTDVFPHVRVFQAGMALVLLGSEEAFPPVDLALVESRVRAPRVAASLAEIGIRGPVELLSLHLFDEVEARRFAGDAPRNTDDLPRIEFFAPRGIFLETIRPNLAALREVRPDPAERARRQGIPDPYQSSFVALASALDDTDEGMLAVTPQDGSAAAQILRPIADSGHRWARHMAAGLYEYEARVLAMQNDLAGAEEKLRLAVRDEPDRSHVQLELGRVSLLLGKHDQAERALREAAQLVPRSVQVHMLLGYLEEAQGRRDEAEASYARALALRPGAAEILEALERVRSQPGAEPVRPKAG